MPWGWGGRKMGLEEAEREFKGQLYDDPKQKEL